MKYSKTPVTDIVDFNPSRTIKKGTVSPFIDMAALPTSSRDIDDIYLKEFKNGGAKFKNGDT
ncbi:restriction endonuclease subunit S, partial [Vibrio parahaemolyticus]|nr:restriction endonuclease subunit S [Vibrio parahaemolyticus]